MRVSSPLAASNGGWIHRDANQETPRPATRQVQAEPETRLTLAEVSQLVDQCSHHPRAHEFRSELADKLLVPYKSLHDLRVGCGYDERRGEWYSTWSERDAARRFVGLVRRYADGSKKTYRNTQHGLIYADDMPAGEWMLLPEGGSDTAAILGLSLPVIGRPSNLGGLAELVKYCKLHRFQQYRKVVVVLGEHDFRSNADCGDCMNCGRCWPGRFGAIQTAKRLQAAGINAWWSLLPDAKDARAWIAEHFWMSGKEFMSVVRKHSLK